MNEINVLPVFLPSPQDSPFFAAFPRFLANPCSHLFHSFLTKGGLCSCKYTQYDWQGLCGEVGIMCIGRNLLINSCGKGNLGRKGEPQRNGARVERKPLTIIHTLTEVQGNPFDLFVNSHFTVSRRNSTEYWGSKEIPAHTRVFKTTNAGHPQLRSLHNSNCF